MIYISFCIDWEGGHFRDLGALKHLLAEIVSGGYGKNFEGTGQDDINEHYPIFSNYIKQLWGKNIQQERDA